MPVLTPNSIMYYESSMIPEDDPDNIVEKDIINSHRQRDLRKRVLFIKKYKEAVWLRWRHEYLTGLRERQKVI